MKKSNPVFIISLIICVGVALWAVVLPDSFAVIAGAVFNFCTVDFAWLYNIAMFSFVIYVIYLALSKFGKIKLGPDDSMPEYSNMSWFAMLFGCGMGVGLVFWGIAQPIAYLIGPMAGLEPGDMQATAAWAMRACFMDWGFSPWANYAVIGLGLAYFQFRKNKPALISTLLEPLIGEKNAKGALGKVVDILAIFATMAGVVTSLGLGTMQISSGLNFLFGVPVTTIIQAIIIGVVTIIVIWSAVSGIDKGIKAISDINLYVAIGCLVVCFIIGPTLADMNALTSGFGAYLQNFVADSLFENTFGDNSWTTGWRVFYWAWFIAWAPFVGVFIARISRGRTVREFVAGVVLVPAMASIVWFSVFGSMGLAKFADGTLSMDQLTAIAGAPETGLFTVLSLYPIGSIISVVIILLVFTFFITSANSGTFVLGMLSSEGNLNPTSSRKILWGAIQALMALGLLIAGGLKPVQTISIAAAFPFIFVMIAAMVALVKALQADVPVTEAELAAQQGEAAAE